MQDEGRGKALVEEGGSLLKRPWGEGEEEEEDSLTEDPNLASASGTKAEVIAKRPCVADSLAGSKAEVEGRRGNFFCPSAESGWTWVPCNQDPFYGPFLPEEEEEDEEEEIDDSDCIYGLVDGHYVVVGYAPKPPRLLPAVYDPEEDDPYGVTYEMYCRRRAELKGRHVYLDDPLFTERITTWGGIHGHSLQELNQEHCLTLLKQLIGSSSLIKGNPDADSSAPAAAAASDSPAAAASGNNCIHSFGF